MLVLTSTEAPHVILTSPGTDSWGCCCLLLAAYNSFLPENLLHLLSNNTQMRALRHIRKILSFPADTQ